jgi:amino acid transporter
MTHVRDRFLPPNESQISWVDADPRRAPLRNDLVTALEVALAPAVFWFIFFTPYYALRTAVIAATIVTLITFGIAFVVTWGRMASARRRGATLRSPRRRLPVALGVSVVLGVATISTSASGYPDTSIQVMLGLGAGLFAGLLLLALERFAVNVPAVSVPAVEAWTRQLSRHRGDV